MSSDIHFFIEVRDNNKNWQVIKYIENFEYGENHIPDNAGENYYKLKYPYELKKIIYVGKSIRDALHYKKFSSKPPLPNDITAELKNAMEEKVRHIAISGWGKNIDFESFYSWMHLSDLEELYEQQYKNWTDLLKRDINSIQENVILKKIDEAKNEIINKLSNKEENTGKTEDNQSSEENTNIDIENNLNELEDIIQLKSEIRALREYVVAYTGNIWVKDEDIRIYFFYE